MGDEAVLKWSGLGTFDLRVLSQIVVFHFASLYHCQFSVFMSLEWFFRRKGMIREYSDLSTHQCGAQNEP